MPEGEMAIRAGRGSKYEKHIYYRRPQKGEEAGWIIVAASVGGSVLTDLSKRGFEPLWKYGQLKDGETNKWKQILSHPDGPAEFPADQVMTFRWYKPEDCPIPGVNFPQLQGHKIIEYQCPECSRPAFVAMDGVGGIEHLARHLRLIHSWDRPSLVKYGEEAGVNFDAIYSHVQRVHEFGEEPTTTPEEANAVLGAFDCGCGWKPKPRAKRPEAALRMHKQHCQLVTV
jgi:hypothetical protein